MPTPENAPNGLNVSSFWCRISQAVVSLGMLLLPINPSTINFVANLSLELDNAPSTMASSDFLAAVQLRLEEQHMKLDA
jgi:hypothetical protein